MSGVDLARLRLWDSIAANLGPTPIYDEAGEIVPIGEHSEQGGVYVVWYGRAVGVFYSWGLCNILVNSFPGNAYKRFETLAEARRAWVDGPAWFTGNTWTPPAPRPAIPTPRLSATSDDAAVSSLQISRTPVDGSLSKVPITAPPRPVNQLRPTSTMQHKGIEAVVESDRAQDVLGKAQELLSQARDLLGELGSPPRAPSSRRHLRGTPSEDHVQHSPAHDVDCQPHAASRGKGLRNITKGWDSYDEAPSPFDISDLRDAIATAAAPERLPPSPKRPTVSNAAGARSSQHSPGETRSKSLSITASSVTSTTTSVIEVPSGRTYVVLRGDCPGVYLDKETAWFMMGNHAGGRITVFRTLERAQRFFEEESAAGRTGLPVIVKK
ncbi:hypothetical protein ACG7TL_002986 [Trametes sanguinea]